MSTEVENYYQNEYIKSIKLSTEKNKFSENVELTL